MYDNFSDRARRAMQLSQSEAKKFKHTDILPEHILLGIIKDEGNVATNIIKNLGVGLEKVRLELKKLIQLGPDIVSANVLPLSSSAREVLKFATQERGAAKDNCLGTEYLLLGLAYESLKGSTISGKVLAELGLTYSVIKNEMNRIKAHTDQNPTSQAVDSHSNFPEAFSDAQKLQLGIALSRILGQLGYNAYSQCEIVRLVKEVETTAPTLLGIFLGARIDSLALEYSLGDAFICGLLRLCPTSSGSNGIQEMIDTFTKLSITSEPESLAEATRIIIKSEN